MKRAALIFISLFIPIILIASCEHSTDPELRSPSYASSSASTSTSLTGTWVYADESDSGSDGILGNDDDNWSTSYYIFTDTTVTSREITYYATSTGAKGAPFLQYDYVFTYTTGSAGAAADSTKIDKILSDITLTPKSAAVALVLNTVSYGGFTNWAANTAKSIAGKTIDSVLFESAGLKDFDIYKISGSSLYMGDTSGTNDGSTDALRPTAFETIYGVKQ